MIVEPIEPVREMSWYRLCCLKPRVAQMFLEPLSDRQKLVLKYKFGMGCELLSSREIGKRWPELSEKHLITPDKETIRASRVEDLKRSAFRNMISYWLRHETWKRKVIWKHWPC